MINQRAKTLWTVESPGNLLLFGEYLVLEEGGMGLSVALGGPARCQALPLHTPQPGLLVLEGFQSPSEPPEEWFLDLNNPMMKHPEQWETTMPLLHAVWAALSPLVLSQTDQDYLPQGLRLKLDTRSFFNDEGMKRGFGSSAAAACCLTAGLMRAFDLPGWECAGPVFPLALQAHRLFQGGAGSGYDVATSCFGGLGLFIGGTIPVWQKVDLPWLTKIQVFDGTQSVSTPASIGSYGVWKQDHAGKAAAFLKRNNKSIQSLLQTKEWNEARSPAEDLKAQGIELGDILRNPARITVPDNHMLFAKASGAGNELGFALGSDEAIPYSHRGLSWGYSG